MGTPQGQGSHPHRYVILKGGLWRISENNYRRALEMVKGMNARDIEIDTDQFHMVQVDTIPADWSTLSSAEAEALLMGMPPEAASEVEREQGAIENDLGRSATQLAQDVIEGPSSGPQGPGEGEPSEAEVIGQDEFQRVPDKAKA